METLIVQKSSNRGRWAFFESKAWSGTHISSGFPAGNPDEGWSGSIENAGSRMETRRS